MPKGLEEIINVHYSTVHITVITMTRNTVAIECYDLIVVHEESDGEILSKSVLS